MAEKTATDRGPGRPKNKGRNPKRANQNGSNRGPQNNRNRRPGGPPNRAQQRQAAKRMASWMWRTSRCPSMWMGRN